MSGLLVARVLLFFSFTLNGEQYQCALIHWYSIFGDQPDPDNGMWVVTPDYYGSAPNVAVVHIDSIFRAAHLLPIFDAGPIPRMLNYTSTLLSRHEVSARQDTMTYLVRVSGLLSGW